MATTRRFGIAVSFLVVALAATSAVGWWAAGHRLATRTAVAALGERVPAFFTEGAEAIVHGVSDPDMLRQSGGVELATTEGPNHYFDLELLGGVQVPPTRRRFLELCRDKGLDPAKTGLLPYAVVEWTQRLTVAFAEHRKWPENRYIHAKCLVYAGLLAHYAQDLCQPLHTTVHFDGRTKPDGSSPHTGIHGKMDDLLGRSKLDPTEAAKGIRPQVLEPLLPALLEEIRRSHSLVDRVYALEQQLPTADESWTATPAVDELANERLLACAQMTANLYLTAWQKSAKTKLPDWLDRPPAPYPDSGLRTPDPDP